MKNKVIVLWGSVISKEKSFSYKLTEEFLNIYKSKNPNDEIEFLDLNILDISSKSILTNQNFETFFKDPNCDKYINKLKNANKVIISCPMTNFNVPTTIKNYLDHILVADKTFSYKYSKKGDAIGLLDNLKVQILTTQGAPIGWYKWGSVADYLYGTWKFVGAKVCKPLIIAGTKIPQNKEKSPKELIEEHISEIRKCAEIF